MAKKIPLDRIGFLVYNLTMITKNLYLLRLTVYQYDKKKTKMDYSCIPVTVFEAAKNIPTCLKSEVSDEKIKVDKMFFHNAYLDYEDSPLFVAGEEHSKKKEGKAVTTSVLFYSRKDLDEEELMKTWLFKLFKRRWFYKRKYIKFINKKILMKQF